MTKTARDSTDLFRQRQVEALQSVDRSVEALVQALDAAGRLDNAVIIYMSDNGLALGEHRYAKGKGCAYEPCIQVPFMIRAPGVAPRVDDHLISNVDLAPTIAALAGVTPLPPVDGMDLGPLLSNPAAPWRDAVFIEYLGKSRLVNFQGVRTATHVYVEYENGDQELYDLPADPDQLTNVVDDPEYASTVAELRDKLNDLRTAEPSAPIEGRAPAR